MTNNYTTDNYKNTACYHCGENCFKGIIRFDDKNFCCDGCKLVYDLLRENNLCTYYNLNQSPGTKAENVSHPRKYSYLDNDEVKNKLIRFKDGEQTHITFYIPKMHCSSCIWLLEHINRFNKAIISATVNFLKKEVTIIFKNQSIKLSEVVTLMAHIGYEPLINLNDLEAKPGKAVNKTSVLKIGIAGFCFGNIMMLSFPEYFSIGNFNEQPQLKQFFGYLNLLLSLPVFFFCASDFFTSAWKSIRHRYLNIDAPIALAIAVTFARSIYEIISQTGSGYMDSMTGIVFFMLIGRYFQNRTYETLAFDRDYKSYFPVGVTLLTEDGVEVNIPISKLKKGDHILIRNNELIPSDALLLSNYTHIDYSFITGESTPIKKVENDIVYAGGKQIGGTIELQVTQPTSQSYLTQLWNKSSARKEVTGQLLPDKINKYFTTAVLSIAALTALYWIIIDSSMALNAFTAILIVACPCGLLLTSTFTNGNILRILGKSKFYLKNAAVIDKLASIDTVLLDKTGTITHGTTVNFIGKELNQYEYHLITSLAAQSSHPLSRKICTQFQKARILDVTAFEELPGMGIKGYVNGKYILLGSAYFVTGARATDTTSTEVFLMMDGEILGYFSFNNTYRDALKTTIEKLSANYNIKLLSGDNNADKNTLKTIFGTDAEMYFNQKPEEKMLYVKQLQQQGHKIMMVGDGLNDAGALKQSNVGIAVSDDTNNFSPACDAILDGSSFTRLPAFISFAKSSKKIILVIFMLSLTYNLIGLYYAVNGLLSPVIAAILMPISSVSVVVLATVLSTLLAIKNKIY